ncbi:MAG TPA: glycosyltransferase family 2 protein [Steroidobacteraceae bacterium]|nr:glycosyltransferase family 2 protein [Steroidobacteraceae bacterium]
MPARDEAPNIVPLVGEIRRALEGRFDYEIICVDDGSEDRLPEALRAVRATAGTRLRVLRHERSCGQSTAVWNGVQAAGGDLVATLDGDGQNDPADIPQLVTALLVNEPEGVRLVNGHRTRRNDNFIRLVSSRIANSVRGTLLGDQTPDTGCGLKVFRREVYLALPYFDHMHRFLPALIQRQGGRVLSVPVNHRSRTRGRSKYGIRNRLWAGIVDLIGVAWLLRRERRPSAVLEEFPE